MRRHYISELRPSTDVLFITQVKYDREEPWWNDVDRVKLHIRAPELSEKPTIRVI
jgi:hypothetical protein